MKVKYDVFRKLSIQHNIPIGICTEATMQILTSGTLNLRIEAIL